MVAKSVRTTWIWLKPLVGIYVGESNHPRVSERCVGWISQPQYASVNWASNFAVQAQHVDLPVPFYNSAATQSRTRKQFPSHCVQTAKAHRLWPVFSLKQTNNIYIYIYVFFMVFEGLASNCPENQLGRPPICPVPPGQL